MTTRVLSQEDRDLLHFEMLLEHHEEDMSWTVDDLEDDDDADA
jgi:hypothetical protein